MKKPQAMEESKNAANEIPQNQQDQCQRDIGQQGSGGNADDCIAKDIQQIQDGTDDGAGKDGFAYLFTNNVGEKEGIHGAKKGIRYGNDHPKQKIHDAGQQAQAQNQQ